MAKNKKKLKVNPHAVKSKPATTKNPKHQPAPKPAAPKKTEPTIPFQPEDRILLVGEGDFSFATSIVREHGCCDVTATCFDAQSELFEKYQPQGEENTTYLTDEGQTVLYGVDATKLDTDKQIKKARGGGWDAILFNFPHVGGKSKDVNRQVRFNQELLVKFFTCASLLVAQDGTIVVTLFEGEPYTLWNIRDLARHAGLDVKRSFRFVSGAYPGYRHARTLGNLEGGGGWKGEDREARSYVFQAKAPVAANGMHPDRKQQMGGKRKRSGESDSSDDDD
ncbi:Hypothetical protein R9X50_00390900 [Acrodontium crateriforme]|uniref:25S rRNA (uridine-N(3))-methyltransferase BMT5-like domain-containing protein n=1 Tax=Acrodontium crateriforme TaxID=150365 RepID=A0AAQ3M4B5_9PEZI|nr:Hypothetical protein R9X50_00390900 [Acrodontium crateriforme]